MALVDILYRTFYGNTVQEWGIALLIVLGAFLVGKTLYWISSHIFKKMASKTETKLDDIIVDMVEEPVMFAIIIAGVWYAIKTLFLPEVVLNFVGGVYQVLIVFVVAWLVSRLLDAIFQEYLVPLVEKSDSDLDDQLLPIVRKGSKTIIWVLAIIIALNNAGYNVSALLAGLGIGGLAFAMAAKDSIANIFGGITIFTDKPFKINDRIKVNGVDGTVKEIGVRSTRLQTLEGRIVTIPNSKFADSAVENVTREPSRKVVLQLGLTYDTTPDQMEQAMKILKAIAEKNKGVKEDYAIGFTEFGDFALGIKFIYYIKKSADIMGTQNEVNMEILKQFNKEKLDFAFPTQTLYTKKA